VGSYYNVRMSLTRRKAERIRLPEPIVARVGTMRVNLVDLSILGAGIEHPTALSFDEVVDLVFEWDAESISVHSRVIRCKLERFSGGLTVYRSGLFFMEPEDRTTGPLRKLIASHVQRALDEQKANARGAPPPKIESMPIFREGVLTRNKSDLSAETSLPTSRIMTGGSYVACRLDRGVWRKMRTSVPAQPEDGFTVSVTEEPGQIDLLCESYRAASKEGRELIQTMAELSIAEGERKGA
jgi:hypothetical protein